MNAEQVNRILEREIYRLRAGKTKPAHASAMVKLTNSLIGSARLELQFARAAGALAHSPFYRTNGARALAAPTKKNGKRK